MFLNITIFIIHHILHPGRQTLAHAVSGVLRCLASWTFSYAFISTDIFKLPIDYQCSVSSLAFSLQQRNLSCSHFCIASLVHSDPESLLSLPALPVHNFQFIVADSKQVFTQQIATL